MKPRNTVGIFLVCVALLGSNFCASQIRPKITVSEIQKLERNYRNQGYTLETLRKNMDLIKKTLNELTRRVAVLESNANKNSRDIQQIQAIRRDMLELKKLLREFKRRYLR